MVSKLSREEKTKAKTGLAQDVDSLVDQLVDMDINQEAQDGRRALSLGQKWTRARKRRLKLANKRRMVNLVMLGVSLHPYSGAATPPKFGDFEAQRHWMEITLNLPVKEWYRNSTLNDLSYWGLDYPPLTAYQSYVHGLFVRFFSPESVALTTSRGHESYLGKLLMRWTVLSSDALVLFPAVFYFIVVYYSGHKQSGSMGGIAWHIAIILLNPCLILIDHGHFQYNCISLGLTVGAIAAILSDKDLLACVLYSLALNHKQMSAYFAPAFFSHLLGKCIRRRYPLLEVFKLGLVVSVTFLVVWWPYVHSMEAFFGVLSRLAPFERGIYEDFVANFWCTTSVLVKWKRLFSTPQLKVLSLGATISTFLPSMIQQIWDPSKKGFLYGLLNSALSFYLFSFQVHEKSILLPLLPVRRDEEEKSEERRGEARRGEARRDAKGELARVNFSTRQNFFDQCSDTLPDHTFF
ncbi:hypothetical protein ACLB2K_053119 [Fragaria x ananassa]